MSDALKRLRGYIPDNSLASDALTEVSAEIACLSSQLSHERLTTEDALRRTADYAVQVERLSSQLHEAQQERAALQVANDRYVSDNTRLHENVSRLQRERDGEVWLWQGDGEDHPESLACPVLMHAEDVRKFASLSSQLAGMREALTGVFDPEAASPLQHDGPCAWWDNKPCNCRIKAIVAALSSAQEPK